MAKKRERKQLVYLLPVQKRKDFKNIYIYIQKRGNPGSIKGPMPALPRGDGVAVRPELHWLLRRRIPMQCTNMVISASPEIESIAIPSISHCFGQGSFGNGCQCNLDSKYILVKNMFNPMSSVLPDFKITSLRLH